MASVDHHRDSQVSLSAIPQPDSKDKTSNFRNDRGFRHPPAFLINRRWSQRKIGQGQGYINDTSQTQPHESPYGTWDPERQEYYDANSYDGSRLYSWIWDPERLEWYYFSSLDGPRIYNTLNWDPHNRTYIHKNHDKNEDTYTPNPSGQGRESNDPASEAVTQTGYRPPSPLGPLPRKSLAMRLEWKKGDSGNTPTDVETDPIRITSATPPSDNSQDADHGSRTPNLDTHELPHHLSSETISWHHWREIHSRLPVDWKWDFEYHITNADHSGQHGSWTCTPLEPDEPKCYPLTIAGAPVVLPVEYRWPPESGVTPPPDPRATTPIDCRATLSLELVKDLFLTFKNSIGFYVLINGLLQVIVPEDYDTSWASSHLPHKYGGLKVCYIEQNLEPTMLPSATDTSRITASGSPVGSHDISGIFRPASLSTQSITKYPSLKLNDFIEARAVSNHRRERFSGRVGLRVTRAGLEPLVVMSTHVITEAILAKSHRDTIFGRGLDDRFRKLEDDWNKHIEIWARDKKIGTIDKTFDTEVKLYPVGFKHDITLIKPSSPAVVEDIASPIANLGWLHQNSWNSLRQQTSTVKILADTESTQSGKSIKCSRPSDVLVVGEGIFLNQKAAAGSSKSLKDHDASTWNDLVSRALLYRVYPDFDPPNGHSGTALYADGVREDGTEGPGIVGFQSFVQRCGRVQSFDMEGPALERRLQLGVVAFYGAFEVPPELKQYDIV